MGNAAFETLEIYRLSESIADLIWNVVNTWSPFARDTVGKQIVRAADSIGANIAEGFGRGSDNDHKRFLHIARGSLNETLHFLRRAFRRGLMTAEQVTSIQPRVDKLGPKLNAFLNSIGRRKRHGTRAPATNHEQQTTNGKE
jgi:four helix bundle protein